MLVQTVQRSCKWPTTENNEHQDEYSIEYLQASNLWTGKYPDKKKKNSLALFQNGRLVVSLLIFFLFFLISIYQNTV